ncbi:hypothetical protein DFH06DRAFT_1146654 [Mycena polygramma]|nr:hypothetical protein DFH06DRAFT_1146654 [Mycena polygramma]
MPFTDETYIYNAWPECRRKIDGALGMGRTAEEVPTRCGYRCLTITPGAFDLTGTETTGTKQLKSDNSMSFKVTLRALTVRSNWYSAGSSAVGVRNWRAAQGGPEDLLEALESTAYEVRTSKDCRDSTIRWQMPSATEPGRQIGLIQFSGCHQGTVHAASGYPLNMLEDAGCQLDPCQGVISTHMWLLEDQMQYCLADEPSSSCTKIEGVEDDVGRLEMVVTEKFEATVEVVEVVKQVVEI